MYNWTTLQAVLITVGLSALTLVILSTVVTVLCVRRRKVGNNTFNLWHFNAKTLQTCPYSENNLGESFRYGMPLYNMDNFDFDSKSNFRNIHLDRTCKVRGLSDIPEISKTEGEIDGSFSSEEPDAKKTKVATDQRSVLSDVDPNVGAQSVETSRVEWSRCDSNSESDQFDQAMVEVDLGTPQEVLSMNKLYFGNEYESQLKEKICANDTSSEGCDTGNISITVLGSHDICEESVPY